MKDCVKIDIKHNTIIFPSGITEEDIEIFYNKLKELPILLEKNYIKFPNGTSENLIKAYYMAASVNWHRDFLPPFKKKDTIKDYHPQCTDKGICDC